MSAYTLRQLQEDPEALLRELEAGGLPVIIARGRPAGVVVPFEHAVRLGARAGLAARLLAAGVITIGTAAQIADRSVEAMVELMGELGYQNVFADLERLNADLDSLDHL